MLLVVVALWLIVYLPSLGNKSTAETERSTRTRNSKTTRNQMQKKPVNGVSNLVIRNKNIQRIRAIFLMICLASLIGIAYGIATAFTNPMQLTISAVSLAVLTISLSALRSSNKKQHKRQALSAAEAEAARRRMAYLIRESALVDVKPDELFDERAWSDVALPESLLSRNFGAIDTSNLAEVVSFESIKSTSEQKKLAADELDLILKRRRANK